jgi:histidine triad (HIT) family protein
MSISGPYDDQNIFAKIIRGEMPAVKIYEDADVLSIMDVFPQAPGHVLVIPKKPVRNMLDMSAEALVTTMAQVQRHAKAMQTALAPDGIMLVQFSGEAAGQTVFHVHFHLIPRINGDTVGPHGGGMADMTELEAHAAKVRAALR